MAHESGKEHGEYECAIGSCEGTRSSFTLMALKNHLYAQHDVEIKAWELKPGQRMITTEEVSNLGIECHKWPTGLHTLC